MRGPLQRPDFTECVLVEVCWILATHPATILDLRWIKLSALYCENRVNSLVMLTVLKGRGVCVTVLNSIHLWALFIVPFPGAVQLQSGLVCHCVRCCSNSCVNVEWLLPWGYYSEIINRMKNRRRCGGEGGRLQWGALVWSGLWYVQPDTKWWAFHLFISLLPSKQLASLSFVYVLVI